MNKENALIHLSLTIYWDEHSSNMSCELLVLCRRPDATLHVCETLRANVRFVCCMSAARFYFHVFDDFDELIPVWMSFVNFIVVSHHFCVEHFKTDSAAELGVSN